MATYTELLELKSDSTLRDKIAVASVVKAQSLLAAASPTANEVAWAYATLANPIGRGDVLFSYVLAANKDEAVSTIQNASDAIIQSNVDDAADQLIAGGVI